jgi:hypothetical protein
MLGDKILKAAPVRKVYFLRRLAILVAACILAICIQVNSSGFSSLLTEAFVREWAVLPIAGLSWAILMSLWELWHPLKSRKD